MSEFPLPLYLDLKEIHIDEDLVEVSMFTSQSFLRVIYYANGLFTSRGHLNPCDETMNLLQIQVSGKREFWHQEAYDFTVKIQYTGLLTVRIPNAAQGRIGKLGEIK